MASITGLHHVALTVTDADKSADWYGRLLGAEQLLAGDDDIVSYRILSVPGADWALGLRQYHGREAGVFDEFRAGMDHLAFGVSTREELEEWERTLSERDIPFTPIAETPIGSVIVFRDPDNTQLEFWLPGS